MEMKKYKLGEIASFIGSGMTPLRSNENYWSSKDYPWLKTEQLGEYQIFDTNEYISKVALEETNLKLFPKNTLSVAMYGEGKTRGNVSILAEQMTTNQACCNIIVDNKFANYKFVYYWLKNSYYKLRSLSSGIRNNLNSEDIKKFEINLPSLPTQQKIATVLSSLDDKIALNKKINAKLEAMAKRLYDYWFVQFDFPNEEGKPYKTSGGKMVWNEVLKREIPEGWEVKSVFEASDVLYGYPYATEPFDEDNLELSKKPYKVVRIRDIQNNSFSAKTTEVVDEKYKTKQNDLLVGMDGYFHMNFWFSNNDYINQRIVRFRKTLISTLILNFQIKPFIKFKETMAKGSTVGHLSDKDLKQLFIAIPNDNSISDRFDSILNMITKNNSEIQKLTELRDRLLPLLMNGQVVTN